MNHRAFTLMELMIVIVIIGILTAVGMVMFGGQAEKAKIAATNANFKNIHKFLVVEFFKCQFDSSELIFNTHKCSDSNPPTTSLIGNFISNKLRFKNPYNFNSPVISTNPCYLGSIVISSTSAGYYWVTYYSNTSKKIYSTRVTSQWVPSPWSYVGGQWIKNIIYTPVFKGCPITYKPVSKGQSIVYTKVTP